MVLEALTKQRENSSFLPSFEERVAIDISAVACTMIEICCIKHLRASLPAHASLLERMTTIRRLMKSGQLHIPRYDVCPLLVMESRSTNVALYPGFLGVERLGSYEATQYLPGVLLVGEYL